MIDKSISCGDLIINSTDYDNRYKFYKFTLSSSMYVTFSTCNSTYDTYLYLYDNDGYLLQYNDDSSECGLDAILKTGWLNSGDYIVGVSGFRHAYGTFYLAMNCFS